MIQAFDDIGAKTDAVMDLSQDDINEYERKVFKITQYLRLALNSNCAYECSVEVRAIEDILNNIPNDDEHAQERAAVTVELEKARAAYAVAIDTASTQFEAVQARVAAETAKTASDAIVG